MTRRKLEFCALGAGAFLLYLYRKAVFKEYTGQTPLAGTSLYASAHPSELAYIRRNRYKPNRRIPGTPIPLFGQPAHKRIRAGLYKQSAVFRRAFNYMLLIFHAPAPPYFQRNQKKPAY